MKNIVQSTAVLLLLNIQSQVFALSTAASKPAKWTLVANLSEPPHLIYNFQAEFDTEHTHRLQLMLHQGAAEGQPRTVQFTPHVAAGSMTFNQGKGSFRVFIDKASKQITLEPTSIEKNKEKHDYESLSLTPFDVEEPYLTYTAPPPPGSDSIQWISQIFFACPSSAYLDHPPTYFLYTHELPAAVRPKCKEITVTGHRLDQTAK